MITRDSLPTGPKVDVFRERNERTEEEGIIHVSLFIVVHINCDLPSHNP